MLERIKKIKNWTEIISLILLAIFTFLYFETKRIESLLTNYPMIVIEKTSSLIKENTGELKEISLQAEFQSQNSKKQEVPLATPAPGSDFILPEAALFELKEEISPAKKVIQLPILMYHHVNYLAANATKVYRDLTVTPQIFEKQMKYLFEQKYQPITFEKFISYLKEGEKIPEKSLIITFDDGWKNQYKNALPVLKKYNFQATFFVVVNYIGGSSLMNWEELKELLSNGMEIGSHTMNHPNLRGLSEENLKYEIQNSKVILEKGLGQKISVFAYPYGTFDSKVVQAVKDSNYLAARSCIDGVDQNPENVYTLKTIQVYDNLYQFKEIFPPEE